MALGAAFEGYLMKCLDISEMCNLHVPDPG